MTKKKIKRNLSFEEVIADTMSASEFHILERPLGERVFYSLLVASLLIAMVFTGRAVFLSAIRGEDYALRSDDNVNQNIPLIAPRGLIVDRFGEPLVKNKPVFSVFLHIDQMVRHGEQEQVLSAVRGILGIEEPEIIELIESTNLDDVSDIILASDIPREQVVEVQSLGLRSLNTEESFSRDYISQAYSHVVGYVGLVSKEDLANDDSLVLNDFIGRGGLEVEYDSYLRGQNGRVSIVRDSRGEIEEIARTREPLAGGSLETTIDIGLQDYFYSRMLSGLLGLGRTSGTGLAIDPRSGEVLALLSFPSFDGDNVSASLGNVHEPLFNRAVSGVYNPGSTIKPLHAAAALHEGVVDPGTSVFSAGYIEIPNPFNPDQPSRFVDWKPHGWVNAYSGIARSSNVYFYVIGGGFEDKQGLGIERLAKYWETFGLGEPSDIDLPGERVGFLPSPDEKESRTGDIWRIGDTYNVSIGQGDLAVTPTRLLSATAAIGNGGTAYTPHLSKAGEAEVILDIRDMEEALVEVQQGMIDAVTKDYGTANLLSSVPMHIGAKTGSAQVSGNTKTNALITAYAARDENSDPEIAILALIEDAREGSLNAVPIARDVLQWYYDNRVNTPEDVET